MGPGGAGTLFVDEATWVFLIAGHQAKRFSTLF